MAAGARGVKIWKNAGMTLKNEDGQFLMADDPVFAPIFEFLEKEKIPLLAHLGEPRKCWLPLEEMSSPQYYIEHPEFHAYLHPEIPSYEQQIIARDHILERYPGLIFIGAHLGSMEWNLEEVAKRLDKFPNFYIDLSGRMGYIYEQIIRNRNYIIDFFQTYQNRILYGSDFSVKQFSCRKLKMLIYKFFPQIYMNLYFRSRCKKNKKHWLLLATDKVFKTENNSNKPDSSEYVKGLKLSRNVVDRIFYENARFVYHTLR
jgi:predicted TIM-barrel fold metal-dependent hydrolase